MTPSSPPKKYRTQTNGGSYALNGPGPCTASGSYVEAYSGACQYSVSDCSVTSAGIMTVTGVCNNCTNFSSPGTYALCGLSSINAVSGVAVSTVQMKQQQTGCNTSFGTITLTDEDTDSDAYNRAFADPDVPAWSAWSNVCAPVVCCKAQWNLRTSGFSYFVQQAQFKLYADGLLPNLEITTFVNVFRRSAGSSDPWVLFATLQCDYTADGAGVAEFIDDVPNEQGYESYVEVVP